MSPNVAASIKARLLTRAKGEVFELFLVRFACERFLYRLGVSELRDRFILKGAGLLSLWMKEPYRATRDLDLLAFGSSDESSVRTAMETICRIPCPEDGLTFDLVSLTVSPIRDNQKYPGQRAVLNAHLGKARIRLQVDFGFGDVVTPGPEEARLPSLIDRIPVPRVLAYPLVATIAEKLESMVHLGRRNSRMKDFHDIWALSDSFAFEGITLRNAIAKCFERRSTPWTTAVPDALGTAFFADTDLQARWRAYHRSGDFRILPPENFEIIGERVRDFLGPVLDSMISEFAFEKRWPAGGPWRPVSAQREEGTADG